MGDDPDGPDGILEDSWLQRTAPGLIIIFYAKAIVSFDGVLKALRGPNLRAYVSIENKLCLLGFFFSSQISLLAHFLLSLWVKMKI